ncbi:MAG: hypothetical protein NTV62_01245 [Candidatus Gribaldobacteria bacterium]|nr:hypothetical protein [Candidatus Gribaldobacteria bacterium]
MLRALNEAQTAQREKLIEVCSTQLTDIKSNLGKVMKAFSIITGIQAFTALAQPDISFSLKKGVKFNGFDGPKDLQQDTKKAVEAAYDLRDTILGLSKQLRDAVKSKDAPDMKKESGFSFDAPTCETKPATSYSVVTGVTDVGVKGGSVCPDAGAHFKLIEAHFSQVRKYLFDIDLERKNMARLELGPLGLDILKKAPTVFPLVDSVYKKAYSIKQQTQLLWAMGTAVDFAQQQCNCGQSFCKLCLYEKKKDPNCPDGNPDKPCEMVCWAPVCVTGVPLTPDPITQPFCYVTYIMREPLKSMAERLENSLLGK